MTSGPDLMVVSAALGVPPAAWWLRQRVCCLAGSFPACFGFLFSLFFLISINQALVTQVVVSAPCEDAFHYASSLPARPQLISGLTAGTCPCWLQEREPGSAPSSQGARAEPIMDALRSPEHVEGVAGAGQAPGSFLQKQQPQYLQSGASAGTPERLCLQSISSAWDHTFGKAVQGDR